MLSIRNNLLAGTQNFTGADVIIMLVNDCLHGKAATYVIEKQQKLFVQDSKPIISSLQCNKVH